MRTVLNTVDMKIGNMLLLYATLRRKGLMSKRDLSSRTGLSFASVSNACNQLASWNLLKLHEAMTSTGGRKAATLSINENYAYSFVIDLHHTHVMYVGLADLYNNVFEKRAAPIYENDSLDSLLKRISEECHAIADNSGARIFGMCVGISAVQNNDVVLQSNISCLEGVNLKRHLSELFPEMMIVVENDANLSALSQIMQAENTQKNLLFIFLSEGVGLGIVINGSLYKGSNGFAGELGHMKVTGVDKRCKCGSMGCIRMVATLGSIAADLGEYDVLRKMDHVQEYAATLHTRFVQNVSNVKKRVILCGQKIGEVCAALYDIFNPQEILIGGDMGILFSDLDPIIRQQCRSMSKLARYTDLQVSFLETPTEDLIMKGAGEWVCHMWEQNELGHVIQQLLHNK